MLTKEIQDFLKQNKDLIIKAYYEGFNAANYDQEQAGLNKAFDYFNSIFPSSMDPRKNLVFPQCCIFNTDIKATIAYIIREEKELDELFPEKTPANILEGMLETNDKGETLAPCRRCGFSFWMKDSGACPKCGVLHIS